MWEIGKTLKDSEKEFDRTIAYIRDTIAELKKLDNKGSRFEVVEGTIGQIRRSPPTLIPALILATTQRD